MPKTATARARKRAMRKHHNREQKGLSKLAGSPSFHTRAYLKRKAEELKPKPASINVGKDAFRDAAITSIEAQGMVAVPVHLDEQGVSRLNDPIPPAHSHEYGEAHAGKSTTHPPIMPPVETDGKRPSVAQWDNMKAYAKKRKRGFEKVAKQEGWLLVDDGDPKDPHAWIIPHGVR